MTPTPGELFDNYFEVVEADTAELRDIVFRLRYQVYCLETGFEDEQQFPDRKEHDEFDALASHALVMHRASGVAVATVRLVPGDVSRHGRAFPLEQSHPGLLAARGCGPRALPYETTAEISRFAISREFKQRAGEPRTLAGISEANAGGDVAGHAPNDRRAQPFIIMGLFLAIVRLSAAHGYTHWVAAMEGPLLRRLAHFGVRLIPVGTPIDLHGKRQPCMGRIADVLEGVFCECREVWDFATEGGQLWDPPSSQELATRMVNFEGPPPDLSASRSLLFK